MAQFTSKIKHYICMEIWYEMFWEILSQHFFLHIFTI